MTVVGQKAECAVSEVKGHRPNLTTTCLSLSLSSSFSSSLLEKENDLSPKSDSSLKTFLPCSDVYDKIGFGRTRDLWLGFDAARARKLAVALGVVEQRSMISEGKERVGGGENWRG